MFLTKVKSAMIVALLVGGLTIGAVLMTRNIVAEQPRQAQKPPDDSFAFQKLKLDADDLADMTGINVYKFQLQIPKDQRFRLVLREVREEAGQPRWLQQFSFKSESNAPITMRVAFLRLDRKLAGFLLSEEKEAEYRVDCSGCSPGGVATIISQLLPDLPPTRKLLFVSRSAADAKIDSKAMRLITVVDREAGKGRISVPRAELVVEPE